MHTPPAASAAKLRPALALLQQTAALVAAAATAHPAVARDLDAAVANIGRALGALPTPARARVVDLETSRTGVLFELTDPDARPEIGELRTLGLLDAAGAVTHIAQTFTTAAGTRVHDARRVTSGGILGTLAAVGLTASTCCAALADLIRESAARSGATCTLAAPGAPSPAAPELPAPTLDELASFLHDRELHRALVADAEGPYALGVSVDPVTLRPALHLRIVGAPGRTRHTVTHRGRRVPVIVEGGYVAPRAG